MTENYIEKIDNYLSGEMTDQEKSVFESELQTNEELSSLFKMYMAIEKDMKQQFRDKDGQAALKMTLGTLNERYFTGGSAERDTNNSVKTSSSAVVSSPVTGRWVNIPPWRKLAAAAVIVAFVSVGMIWYLQSNRTSENGENTIAKNQTPGVKKNDITTGQPDAPDRSGQSENKSVVTTETAEKKVDERKGKNQAVAGSAGEKLIDPAKIESLLASYDALPNLEENEDGPLGIVVDHMNNEEYKEAITASEEVDATAASRGGQSGSGSVNFYRHYYKAICLFKLNSTNAAIQEMKKAVALSPNSKVRTEAEWYQALALIKGNRMKEAERLLDKLTAGKIESEYKEKATKLKKEIRKIRNGS
jgi:tetratricopeptide (TPR) repeat protein